jgi:hypothetical protein
MARKFLYLVAALIVLFIAGLFALRLAGDSLGKIAFVPSAAFVEQDALAANAYADPTMWLSRPGMAVASDPARWRPPGAPPAPAGGPAFAVFFVHPTSYLESLQWNAPLDDAQSQARARLFLRGMASPFAGASAIWAPRYRQATFGAFLTDKPEAARAIDLAYGDVALAFDAFVRAVGQDVPIVIAGHSQGAAHVVRLLRERVAGTPLEQRVAAVYAIGWPISLQHDLPALGLPACERPDQGGCVVSWSSFAEPAEPESWFEVYRQSRGFDGQLRGESPILCVNPITGVAGGRAPAEANLGTLKPSADLSSGELVAGAVPARCDARGLLLIGDPPELGPYVLPGNNYHVYDVPLFWANLRQDVGRRVQAWSR